MHPRELENRRLLVVEDEYLVAFHLMASSRAGWGQGVWTSFGRRTGRRSRGGIGICNRRGNTRHQLARRNALSRRRVAFVETHSLSFRDRLRVQLNA